MILNEKVHQLSSDFYTDYAGCSEILSKTNRPYCVALMSIDKIQFAIPFRTNIRHTYCYIFSGSPRSANSGLDFTKAVVINKPEYIGNIITIENLEYAEFIKMKKVIANRFRKFIEEYKLWVKDPAYYRAEITLKYTSLQYFHKELGI